MNTVGKRMIDYTASAINTGGEVYKRLISCDDSDPEKQGAIEKEFNKLFDELEKYREIDIFSHKGYQLHKSLNFFSGLRENEANKPLEYILKYRAMMIRVEDGKPLDTVWGTKWNIEHSLRVYFKQKNCFVLEYMNERENDLFYPSNFAGDTWSVDDVSVSQLIDEDLSKDASVVNIYGIMLASGKTLKRTKKFNITEMGIHVLHFFMRGEEEVSEGNFVGEVNVKIINDESNEVVFDKDFNCGTEWVDIHDTITLDVGTYRFEIDGKKDCDIDFVCLYPAVNYPSISIVVGHRDKNSAHSMFLAPGEADKSLDNTFIEPPNEGTHHRYKFWFPFEDDTSEEAKEGMEEKDINLKNARWGYWGETIQWFEQGYFEDLLDALIPVGVKVFNLIGSNL